MSDIVNIELYSASREEYVECQCYVEMQAYGIGGWSLKSIGGEHVPDDYGDVEEYCRSRGVETPTFDRVESAAMWQLRGER